MSVNLEEAGPAALVNQLKPFDLRGDMQYVPGSKYMIISPSLTSLRMLRSGAGSDCVVLCQDAEIAVHKAFLMSRSGWFQQRLKEKKVS